MNKYVEAELRKALSIALEQCDKYWAERNRIHAEKEELAKILQAVTDHFADVMGGPMISGRGITFANGVENIPTIAAARSVLAKIRAA